MKYNVNVFSEIEMFEIEQILEMSCRVRPSIICFHPFAATVHAFRAFMEPIYHCNQKSLPLRVRRHFDRRENRKCLTRIREERS